MGIKIRSRRLPNSRSPDISRAAHPPDVQSSCLDKGDFLIFSLMLFLLVVSLGLVSAQFSGDGGQGFNQNFQYYQPSFDRIYSDGDIQNFWPILKTFDTEQCEASSDFVIGIPPGGCSPMVVRSDLLAEQNVPVFCQLYATKVNPLIKVSSIQSISFKGEYPEGVSGISYHPARAASRSYQTLLGDPLINNIGYVVIILKRNQIEDDLEEWVAGNLTATIRYDLEEAYGAGESEYYLQFEDDGDEGALAEASFWRGSGSLRLKGVNKNSATLEVLSNKDHVLRTITLKEGETGDIVYLPDYYCKAGLKVKLNQVVSPEDSAKLNIDGHELWVRAGTRIINGKCSVQSLNIDGQNSGSVKISCPGESFDLYLEERENGTSLADEPFSSGELESDFKTGEETVRELVDSYSLIEKDSGGITYAEEALLEQINLAEETKQLKTRAELLDLFIEKFPISQRIDYIYSERQLLNDLNYTRATKSVYVTNKYHTIGLRLLRNESSGSKTAEIKIGGSPYEVYEGWNRSIGEGEYVIERIEPGEISISYSKSGVRAKSEPIEEGGRKSLGGKDVYVVNIEVAAVAHFSLIPEIKRTKTEANFTFRIGIEKRAIELSPEKAGELIENINDSLEKWTDINDKLGKTIKAWKGACFATSTFLMLKNVASGFSGASLARQEVMKEYKVICDTQYSDMSHDACYRKLSDEIDGNVSAMKEGLASVNEILEGTMKKHETSGGLLEEAKILNDTAYLEALKELIGGGWNITIDEQEINASHLGTTEQARAVLLVQELERKGVVGTAMNAAVAERDTKLWGVAATQKAEDYARANVDKFTFGEGDSKISLPTSFVRKGVPVVYKDGFKIDGERLEYLVGRNLNLESEGDYRVEIIHEASHDYLFVSNLEGRQEGIWEVERDGDFLKIKGDKMDKLPILKGTSVNLIGGGACDSNEWDPKNAKVRFYDSGSTKGLPSVVPFDLTNGWYAKVSSSSGTPLESSPQGYQASGAVENFYICNIGSNKIIDGADECQNFNIHSAASIEDFGPCRTMSKEEIKRLYDRALDAIRQASRQYGQKTFNIFDQEFGLGAPSSIVGELECQDFMSPTDCNIMFNVCDPVICPSSRCDLGGEMYEADVIRTGIIGGILMCLPNAKEGIKVPLCLSGIHAGLDMYISLLEAEQDCLQENIDSGRLVGICDEVISVYKCEFFWKQAVPIMKLAVPKIIESFTPGGTKTRGGGEYLLVQKAFDNLDASLDYFKSTYAPNAFRAFNLRNVEEAGSEFCQAFVGSSFPTSADAIDSLLEPESPSQFNAHFSESLFSEATLPATSHYKVYYHIFAGNERGVNYRVYLKDPPQTSYYSSSPRLYVKSGYISKGESADESIDFTAPQGYKELCVSIDNQEECGFKAVSSGIVAELVSAKYSEDQALEQDISSEKECISGSPSAIPLVGMNLQAGVEEAINPEIALRGIVRVCATQNPSEGRWIDVGHCGEASLRCYLDKESVSEDIEKLAGVGEALSIESLGAKSKELLEGTEKDNKGVQSVLEVAREDLLGGKWGDDKIIEDLNSVIYGRGRNVYKAEALAIKSSVYRLRVKNNYVATTENNGAGSSNKNGEGDKIERGAENVAVETEEERASGGDEVADEVESEEEGQIIKAERFVLPERSGVQMSLICIEEPSSSGWEVEWYFDYGKGYMRASEAESDEELSRFYQSLVADISDKNCFEGFSSLRDRFEEMVDSTVFVEKSCESGYLSNLFSKGDCRKETLRVIPVERGFASKYDTLGHKWLDYEKYFGTDARKEHYEKLDEIIDRSRELIDSREASEDPEKIVEAIYDAAKSEDVFCRPEREPGRAGYLLSAVLEGEGGDCDTHSIIYVAVGQELGYPLKLVVLWGNGLLSDGHAFVRWDWDGMHDYQNPENPINDGDLNFNPLYGAPHIFMDDEWFLRKYGEDYFLELIDVDISEVATEDDIRELVELNSGRD
jgi:hypothetical protein